MDRDFSSILISNPGSEHKLAQRFLQEKYKEDHDGSSSSFSVIMFVQFTGSILTKNTLFSLPHYPTESTYIFAHQQQLRKIFFLGILHPDTSSNPTLRFRPSELSLTRFSSLECTEDTIISTPSMMSSSSSYEDAPSPLPVTKKPKIFHDPLPPKRELPFPCIKAIGGFPNEEIEGTELIEIIQQVWFHILYPTKYPIMISDYKPWMLIILFICKQAIFSKAYLAYHNNTLGPESLENFQFVKSIVQKSNILETIPANKKEFFTFISENWNY